MKRKILTIILGFVIISQLFSSCKNQTKDSGQRPNIIFIYSDDQRQDAVGFNDNEIIITPELDRMARKGIRFLNANVVFFTLQPQSGGITNTTNCPLASRDKGKK